MARSLLQTLVMGASLLVCWLSSSLFVDATPMVIENPFADPTMMRCWTLGETVDNFNPCPQGTIGVQLSWTSIETNLKINTDLFFEIQLNSSGTTTPMQVSGLFMVCRQGSYDCNPLRTGKTTDPYRLASLPFGPAFANGTRVSMSIRTPYAEKHTFMFVVMTPEKYYYIGVTRDVLSNQATERALVATATCDFFIPKDEITLSLIITKQLPVTGPGLVFQFANPQVIPTDRIYSMHVHETGDLRSYVNALGHFIGASLDANKKYEAGMIRDFWLNITNTFVDPFSDSTLDFVGINGILGRSLIIHNAEDGSRMSQCYVLPSTFRNPIPPTPEYLPIPDYDATVCIFRNGDVLQMEASEMLSNTPTVVIRYMLSNVTADSASVPTGSFVHAESGQVLLKGLSKGAQVGQVTWVPGESIVIWDIMRLGSTIVAKSGADYCVLARADRSGVFFQREYPAFPDIGLPLVPAPVSASCSFNNGTSGVFGHVVFTRVSGDSALCSTASTKYPNCIRMDYYVGGLTQNSGMISLRKYGTLDSAPYEGKIIYPGSGCGDKPSCATPIQPPATYYTITKRPGYQIATGVFFNPFMSLNGFNNIISRGLFIHSTTNTSDPTIVAKCVIGVEALSKNYLAPISQRPEDLTDQAQCVFSDTGKIQGMRMLLSTVPIWNQVSAKIDGQILTKDFWNAAFMLDVVSLYVPNSIADTPISVATVVRPNDDISVSLTLTLANATSVAQLLGRTLGLKSDTDPNVFFATCVVGMAEPSAVITSMPTLMPTPPSPTVPTTPPTLRPPPKADSGQMSPGAIFVIIVVILVVIGFTGLLCRSCQKRVLGQDRQEFGGGIGDWEYQTEMNEGLDSQPLKPLKPSMSRFSEASSEGFQDIDNEEEEKTEHESAAVSPSRRKPGLMV